MGRILVVGGTGILAPAALELVRQGYRVTVLGRGGRAAPPGTDALAADAKDGDALRGALGAAIWDRALVYSPAVTRNTLDLIRSRVAGRCVLVRTSSAVDPEAGEPVVPRDTLQLGWVPATGEVPPRWHSPVEVSRAALDALASGEPRVLGSIRPWAARPA